MTVTVVAIDGPAGSGKSSVSKAAAHMLGFSYYDTGAAYRALAWAALEAGVDLTSEDAVRGVQTSIVYLASEDPEAQRCEVDGVDVSVAIRSTAVTGAVSAVAQHASVRQGLVDHFRHVIEQCDNPGIVMEGRDITTVVAPDAAVRVLLTAPEEVRIQRRQAEFVGTTAAATAAASAAPIAESLRARDASDQTVVDFMNAAPGVVALDSGPLTFDQTVDALLAIISQPRSA